MVCFGEDHQAGGRQRGGTAHRRRDHPQPQRGGNGHRPTLKGAAQPAQRRLLREDGRLGIILCLGEQPGSGEI